MQSKRYRSKKKLNIRPNGIASFGKQFGDEFGKVLSSGFRTTRTPVVKFNKKKNKKEKFTFKDRKELMLKIRKASEKQDHNLLLNLSREYLNRSG